MPFLPPNQQRQSTGGTVKYIKQLKLLFQKPSFLELSQVWPSPPPPTKTAYGDNRIWFLQTGCPTNSVKITARTQYLTPVFRSTVNQFGMNIRFDRRLISSS